VAVKDMIGVAKASAVRTATGIASTASGDPTAPKPRMTRKNRTDSSTARKTIHMRSPASRLVAQSGVFRAAR
jgi:hypothetical protein